MMSKKDLIAKCKELNIKNYSSKNKGELLELISGVMLKISNKSLLDQSNKTLFESELEKSNKISFELEKSNKTLFELEKSNKTLFESELEKSNKTLFESELEKSNKTSFEFKNIEGLSYLSTIPDNSIDLILTDPPYIISKDTGMNEHYNNVKFNEDNNIEFMKTEEEWIIYKNENIILNDDNKDKYLKYGSIYGKKYCVKTDYGGWDSEFTINTLEQFICQFYNKLKKGGTMIMFFDLWKITTLKEIMEKYKFKQIRFIEWVKTNSQPLNSKINYLTNCREIALLGVKGGCPTFNSSYDNGIYNFPLQGGKYRVHPTQKSLKLIEELIKKHSNINDTILDTFLGSGTTAIACKNTGRNFKGCEIDKEYYDQMIELHFKNIVI